MKRRKWTAQQKLQIVLEGLKNQSRLSDICSHYEISQVQYYRWRDQLFQKGVRVFEGDQDKEKQRLETEVRKLKTLVGHLAVELKKTEYELL